MKTTIKEQIENYRQTSFYHSLQKNSLATYNSTLKLMDAIIGGFELESSTGLPMGYSDTCPDSTTSSPSKDGTATNLYAKPRSPMQNAVALRRSLEQSNITNPRKNSLVAMLGVVLRASVATGMIESSSNFSALVEPFRAERRRGNPFTKDEVEKLWRVARKDDRIYANWVRFLFYSGLRKAEFISILVEDKQEGFVKVNNLKYHEKGKTARLIPLTIPQILECVDYAKSYHTKQSTTMFTTRLGKPINKDYVAIKIDDVLDRYGFGKRELRDARRGIITAMHSKGYDIKAIADYIGHKDIRTTTRYVVKSMEEKANTFIGV